MRDSKTAPPLSTKPNGLRLLTALAGFLGYGGWAYWSNLSAGDKIALKAFWVQGLVSFCLTYLLNLYLEWLVNQWTYTGLKLQKIWIVATLSVMLLSGLLHYGFGTPNILITILPGSVLGSLYIFSYFKVLL